MFNHNNQYELTIANFANTPDFLAVAHKLDHVVDRYRLFYITEITDDSLYYHSVEDPDARGNVVFLSDVKIKYRTILEDWSTSTHQPKVGDIFYKLNISNVDDDTLVISDGANLPWEYDASDAKAVLDQYHDYFLKSKGSYQFVSLANIIPIQDRHHTKVLDGLGHQESNAFYVDDVAIDAKYSIPHFLRYRWGVTEDPKTQCEYNLAKQTITFGFDIFESDTTFKPYLNKAIKCTPDGKANLADPTIVELMMTLSNKTKTAFDIKIERVN